MRLKRYLLQLALGSVSAGTLLHVRHVVETMALRWRSLAQRTAANLHTRDEARRIAGQHREAAGAGADSGIRVIEHAM